MGQHCQRPANKHKSKHTHVHGKPSTCNICSRCSLSFTCSRRAMSQEKQDNTQRSRCNECKELQSKSHSQVNQQLLRHERNMQSKCAGCRVPAQFATHTPKGPTVMVMPACFSTHAIRRVKDQLAIAWAHQEPLLSWHPHPDPLLLLSEHAPS